MSYLELDSVIFRGTLNGCVGNVDFGLTADTIDAVREVNIKKGSVSQIYFYEVANISVSENGDIFNVSVPVLHDNVLLDIVAYSNNASHIKIDGVTQDRRNSKLAPARIYPTGKYAVDLWEDGTTETWDSYWGTVPPNFGNAESIPIMVLYEVTNIRTVNISITATENSISSGYLFIKYIRRTGGAA